MDLDLQIERVWGNLAVTVEGEESWGDDSDSDMSDVSTGGYEADIDSSDSEEAPKDGSQDPEKDEDEFWQRVCRELCSIADDHEECNRPEE